MRIDPRRVLAGLFFIFFCLSIDAKTGNFPHQVGVAACFSGDTVKLADRRIVNLIGIMVPRHAHGNVREQFYARESQSELGRITRGRKVHFVPIGSDSKDRHGRISGDLVRDDGESLSELMVLNGAAIFSPSTSLPPELQKKLGEQQRKAISKQAGFWKKLLASPLSSRNYVGNKDTLRFFPADSPQAFEIKPRNRIYFGTLMDAFMAGFAPDTSFSFWPDASSMR